MKASEINGRQTPHVRLDTRVCQACWQCVEVCPKGVIGKVNFFFHKHAVFRRPEQCSGCRSCVKACEHQAITRRASVTSSATQSH
jgi:2-oxoglutarate ferredoxin oxidoreductase subunit delta